MECLLIKKHIDIVFEKLKKKYDIIKWSVEFSSRVYVRYNSHNNLINYPCEIGEEYGIEIRYVRREEFYNINISRSDIEDLENILLNKLDDNENRFNFISLGYYEINEYNYLEFIDYKNKICEKIFEYYDILRRDSSLSEFNIKLQAINTITLNERNKITEKFSIEENIDVVNKSNINLAIKKNSTINIMEFLNVLYSYNNFNEKGYNLENESVIVIPYRFLNEIIELIKKKCRNLEREKCKCISQIDMKQFINFEHISCEYIAKEYKKYIYLNNIENIKNINTSTGECILICRNVFYFDGNTRPQIINFYIKGNIFDILSSGAISQSSCLSRLGEYEFVFRHSINYI
ncbi:hypothetical protein SAMN02745196_02032 [Clostridium collagenovorans DSM 3089]|uniref:Uncharacterized protein n=2 Tax=Clostridium TaxID=1485 RepID=A0A1M5X6I5_9CLOT|nr:hypothetical protein SAMN02745196_02032 [Clostridium collagenovorans DSM 3089]